MITYPRLDSLWIRASSKGNIKDVDQYLAGIWLDHYDRLVGSAPTEVVEVSTSGFSYLFDIAQERLIAAWGISKGKNHQLRDKSRMKGHPLSAGNKYHRGHAIPHTLGGGTDINLVAQNGSVNIGPFRELEKKAVSTPGSLYFTYWEYQKLNSQTPTGVQQGLLCPGQSAEFKWHPN
ncbi:MAG: DNA/RNA non-specific endonuclease [Gammaproteobacteria bacterium]|nr:DNA/RNA non-specific endonuclease [Gammaproteobacteria bacterium]